MKEGERYVAKAQLYKSNLHRNVLEATEGMQSAG